MHSESYLSKLGDSFNFWLITVVYAAALIDKIDLNQLIMKK